MLSTVIERRAFLALAAGGGIGLAGLRARAGQDYWLSANGDAARRYALAAFDAVGQCRFELDLPARGHGIALAPDRHRAVVVARRPGTFAAVVDLSGGRAERWLECPPDRHFHGHGVFSADGRLFYTSENAIASGAGVIGVWAADDGFRRLGELSSHGIEPHDIRLMPDGRTLVVANGGIRTHPEHGRARLNLETMDSSLVHLDARDGALRGQWRLAPGLAQSSIRHLAVGSGGVVAIGMQHQTEAEIVPVAGVQHPGQGIRLLPLPPEQATAVRNYCGSVAMDPTGAIFATSCPRGNRVALWETEGGRLAGIVEVEDGCGVASGPVPGSIMITSGRGGAVLWRRDQAPVLLDGFLADRRWDNHAIRVTPAG